MSSASHYKDIHVENPNGFDFTCIYARPSLCPPSVLVMTRKIIIEKLVILGE